MLSSVCHSDLKLILLVCCGETFVMAKRGDTTVMWGDGPDDLPTTSWTLIRDAANPNKNTAERQAIWETLYRLYGKPLYRRLTRVVSKENADEYVHGFLINILKDNAFMSKVDRTKCKTFRSYLMVSFRNYINYQRRKRRERPLDAEQLAALEDLFCEENKAAGQCEREENRILLDQMLKELEAGCRRDGLEIHWCIFADRLQMPTLEGTKPPPRSEICKKYGVPSPQKASEMIVTVKRRMVQIVRRSLGNRASFPDGWWEELADFIDSFSNP